MIEIFTPKVEEIYQYKDYTLRIYDAGYKHKGALEGYAIKTSLFYKYKNKIIDCESFECHCDGETNLCISCELFDENNNNQYFTCGMDLIKHNYGDFDFWKYSSNILNNLISQINDDIFWDDLKKLDPISRMIKEMYYNNNEFNLVVLKQVHKKGDVKFSSRKSRTFKHTAWATMVKERDKNRCTECGNVHQLHAHHIKSYKLFPELRYDVNNGKTLCSFCHRQHHKYN